MGKDTRRCMGKDGKEGEAGLKGPCRSFGYEDRKIEYRVSYEYRVVWKAAPVVWRITAAQWSFLLMRRLGESSRSVRPPPANPQVVALIATHGLHTTELSTGQYELTSVWLIVC